MGGHMFGGGYAAGNIMILIWLASFVWFVVFTILVVVKLDRIAKLLEKK